MKMLEYFSINTLYLLMCLNHINQFYNEIGKRTIMKIIKGNYEVLDTPSFDDIRVGDKLPDGGIVVGKDSIKTEEGKSLFRRMTVNYMSDDIEVNDLIGKRFTAKSDMANHEFIGTCIGIKKDTDGTYIFRIEDQEGNVFDCSRKDIIMIGE